MTSTPAARLQPEKAIFKPFEQDLPTSAFEALLRLLQGMIISANRDRWIEILRQRSSGRHVDGLEETLVHIELERVRRAPMPVQSTMSVSMMPRLPGSLRDEDMVSGSGTRRGGRVYGMGIG